MSGATWSQSRGHARGWFWAAVLFGAACLALAPLALEAFLVVSSPLQKADAIVLMAGSRLVRQPGASRLYARGYAPRVLLANDGVRADYSPEHGRNLYLAEWAREHLMNSGVPDEAIEILPFTASGTIHDVRNVHDHVAAHPEVRSLLVVTSDYHTRRTRWTFQRVFEGAGVRIGVWPGEDRQADWWRRTVVLAEEFMKYVFYRLRYW